MIRTQEVDIQRVGGVIRTFLAQPAIQAPRGVVIVVHEAAGVTRHIKDIAERLASEGWLAAAPSYFSRQGSPVMEYTDVDAIMAAMGQLAARDIEADTATVINHFQNEYSKNAIGIVGFCIGGSIAMLAAAAHEVGAAVSFYGGGVVEGRLGIPPLLEVGSELKTAWLGLYGDLDDSIPWADVELLRVETAKAQVPTDIVRYPNAGHGFNCNDRPNNYSAEAAADAWARCLAWFDRHIHSVSPHSNSDDLTTGEI
jgi:carboxymethylenebutenolidase